MGIRAHCKIRVVLWVLHSFGIGAPNAPRCRLVVAIKAIKKDIDRGMRASDTGLHNKQARERANEGHDEKEKGAAVERRRPAAKGKYRTKPTTRDQKEGGRQCAHDSACGPYSSVIGVGKYEVRERTWP